MATFSVNGANTYAASGVYAVRVLVTHLSDGQTYALNATVAVDIGSNPGASNPGPVNPGQTGSGQGSGAISDQKKKEKKHPKARTKSKHPAHPHNLHKAKSHPIQGMKKDHAPHKKP